MSAAGELTRMVRREPLPHQPITISASEEERAALARRFELPAIHALDAELSLEPDGDAVRASGTLRAEFDQTCAVAGEPFRNRIDERLTLRFVPARAPGKVTADEEIELEADDLDDIDFSGDMFDLGEAVAQSLALAIDPYAEGPDADAARRAAGMLDEGMAGPFAALAALKKD